VLETSLYVEDLARSRGFYAGLFGLPVMVGDVRFCAFDVAGRDVLLLFRKGGTPEPVATPGGVIPAHDGQGRLHLAFAVDREELDPWEARLRELGVEVESRVTWKRGGRSIYFRDPDGHLLELATPGLWANY
jgi:catechol 2,3-dioxygenase-like lactoylglutathione lyase family enzyme